MLTDPAHRLPRSSSRSHGAVDIIEQVLSKTLGFTDYDMGGVTNIRAKYSKLEYCVQYQRDRTSTS